MNSHLEFTIMATVFVAILCYEVGRWLGPLMERWYVKRKRDKLWAQHSRPKERSEGTKNDNARN